MLGGTTFWDDIFLFIFWIGLASPAPMHQHLVNTLSFDSKYDYIFYYIFCLYRKVPHFSQSRLIKISLVPESRLRKTFCRASWISAAVGRLFCEQRLYLCIRFSSHSVHLDVNFTPASEQQSKNMNIHWCEELLFLNSPSHSA